MLQSGQAFLRVEYWSKAVRDEGKSDEEWQEEFWQTAVRAIKSENWKVDWIGEVTVEHDAGKISGRGELSATGYWVGPGTPSDVLGRLRSDYGMRFNVTDEDITWDKD